MMEKVFQYGMGIYILHILPQGNKIEIFETTNNETKWTIFFGDVEVTPENKTT